MSLMSRLIAHYQLEPHPEGGYYRETYRSSEVVPAASLPARFAGERVFSTAIYFLLGEGNFSAFHKIRSDECWHFYTGQTLLVHVIEADGSLKTVRLGHNVEAGEIFQYVVPAECWFASEPAEGTAFALTGCTVAPGFDFADFELAVAENLVALYPQHETIIRRLCRR